MENQIETQPKKLWHDLPVLLLVFSVILFRTSYTVADPDLWGHVLYGQEMLAAGKIDLPDTYSYLSEKNDWINHEWLCEVKFATAFDLFGSAGLVLLKTSLVMALFLSIYIDFRLQGAGAFRAGLVLLGVSFVMMTGLQTVRPHIFTYLCLFWMLVVIRAAGDGRLKLLWFTPLLTVIWINLHGGILAGLAVLYCWMGTYGLLELYRRRLSLATCLQFAAIVVLTMAATCVNPFGWELPRFLFRTLFDTRVENAEWAALSLTTPDGMMYAVLVLASIWGLWKSTKPRSAPTILSYVLIAIQPLDAVRHLPLFGVAFAVLCGRHVFDAWQHLAPDDEEETHPLHRKNRVMTGLCVACSAALTVVSWPNLFRIHLDPSQFEYPTRAVAYMKEKELRGNTAMLFEWGEYVIWHLSPGIQVSYDGRRETVYSEKIRNENFDWYYGTGDWDAVLDNYPTQLALVSKAFPCFEKMQQKEGWTLLYEDETAAIYVTDEYANTLEAESLEVPESLLKISSDGRGLYFP
jgi:hypothetical protein